MTESGIKTFEELQCWQACRELRLFVHRSVIPLLPKTEQFRLTDQLLRAARSTTANIAEGYGRYHYLDNAKFCSISRGSCWEVLDHLITAADENLIPAELLETARELTNHAVKVTNGYITYLQKAANRQ